MTHFPIAKIISGGQTGADMGGLLAAQKAGIPTGGFAPKGWLTEAGPNPDLANFCLQETTAPTYPGRTKANVYIAQAVLWFGDPNSPGGKLTIGEARRHIKPLRILHATPSAEDFSWTMKWIALSFDHFAHQPFTLLVAGNRESAAPGIAASVEDFLTRLFADLRTESTPSV